MAYNVLDWTLICILLFNFLFMRKRLGITRPSGDVPPTSSSKRPRTSTPIEDWVSDLYTDGNVSAPEFIEGCKASKASSSTGTGSTVERLGEGKRPYKTRRAMREGHMANTLLFPNHTSEMFRCGIGVLENKFRGLSVSYLSTK